MAALPEKIGKYQIASLLGRGGMGEVYKAHDPSLGRFVALKIMRGPALDDAQARERFIREAQAAGGLRHPNIVTVYDLGEFDGQMYIAMEFIHGDDLEKVIRNKMPLSIEDKINIMIQACEGVSYAHKHQIVHRDLKPANIRIDDEGIVKIMDFGIAKLETSNMTASGTVMGTPYYMSPEQVRGLRVDTRSDIFALGAILYETFAYKKAFDGEMAAVFYKIVHEQPEQIQQFLDVPAEPVQEIINRCLEKDKNNRLQTAGELVDLLKHAEQAYTQMNAATVCGIRASDLGPADPDFKLAPAPTAVGTGTRRREEATASPALSAMQTAMPADRTQLASPGAPPPAPPTQLGQPPTVLSPPATGFSQQPPMAVPAQIPGQAPAPFPPAAASQAASPPLAPVAYKKSSVLPVVIILVLILGMAGFGGLYYFVLRGHSNTTTGDYGPQLAEGKRLYNEGKYQEAVAIYQKILADNPNDANVHFLMGAAQKKLFQNDQALQEFQKAVALDPKQDKAWQQLGFIYLDRMDYQNAERGFLQATQLAPGDAANWQGLAQTYIRLQQPDKAEPAYRRLIELEPRNDRALYNLGNILTQKNQLDEAARFFAKATEVNPSYAEAYNNLGAIHAQQGQIDEAINDSQKAIQLKPEMPEPYYVLSECYAKKDDKAEAARYLKKYMEIKPDNSPELVRKLEEYSR